MDLQMDTIYRQSEQIIVREIEGELILVPLSAGVSQGDEELFTLNECGRAIWAHFDGSKTVRQVVDLLMEEYDSTAEEMERDVRGFVEELVRRKMLAEISK